MESKLKHVEEIVLDREEIRDGSVCIEGSRYILSPFCNLRNCSSKVNQDYCLMSIIRILEISVKDPILLPALKDFRKDAPGRLNPLVMQNSRQLTARTLLVRTYLQRENQKKLPT